MTPPVVLTIAGSDSGGGAGVQADLKVFAALRAFGASVITAVTAQNTREVTDVYQLPGAAVGTQLAAVLADLPVAATKIGMVGTAEVAGAIAARARVGDLPNLVLDPVLAATSGSRLGVVGAVERLLPHAVIATPNIDEASALVGWRIDTPADMVGAAAQLASNGPRYVVVTGGDLPGEDAIDALWTEHGARLLRARRVRTRNTHGSGCSFSAAIAVRLAYGDPVLNALAFAKDYVTRAIAGGADWKIGAGPGPLDHFGWSTGI